MPAIDLNERVKYQRIANENRQLKAEVSDLRSLLESYKQKDQERFIIPMLKAKAVIKTVELSAMNNLITSMEGTENEEKTD